MYLSVVSILKTYRGTSKDPAKSAKRNSFQQSQYIQEAKPFEQQAVAGEVYRKGAVDCDAHHKQEEPHSVAHADTIVDEWAVVVKICHATLADATVFSSADRIQE